MSEWPEPPEKLHQRDIWLCWRYEEREDKNGEPYQTKVPDNPNGGGRGDATDPEKRADFESAVRYAKSHPDVDGIGYAFPKNDTLAGVDLDDVRDPETGELLKWARDDVATLDSYTEVSPSDTGLHIVVVGFKPGDKCRTHVEGESEIEMYDEDRFFTYTGERMGDGFDTVEQRHDELGEVYHNHFGSDDSDESGGERDGETPDLDLDDEEVLEKARGAENGEKFERLWNGHDPHDDASYGDKALCQMLAFWTGGDRRQMDSLFRASRRMRAKWDEDRGDVTYGERTIGVALDDQTEFYDPDGGGSDAPDVSAIEEVQTNNGDSDENEPNNGLSLEDRIPVEVLTPLDPPDDWEGETITEKMAIHRTAKLFDEYMSFVRPREECHGWRDALYVYIDGEQIGSDADKGIYEPCGKPEIERHAERLLGPVVTDTFVRELENKIERRNRTRARTLEPDPERLVVNGGILDLTTGEIDPHTPYEYHRTRVNHDYDEDAECPAIDAFLHEIVAEEDVETLYQFIAHALYKDYPEAKAAMLLGDGANGKSMFLSLVEEFLKKHNVSGRSLQDITEYRWAANDLVGNLANIHADMSDQDVDSMRMFKNLTGGDTVDADVKFEKPVKFTNYATMLFACNDMPVLRDDTQGNWRRWVLVNFPNTFDDDDPAAEDARARSDLEAELFTESEMEGLLSRCVEETSEWANGRAWFPNVPGWQATRSKMRRAAEPVFDFAEACLISAEGSTVEKGDVREAYRRYATSEGLPKMEREELGRKLHLLGDYDIQAGQQRASDGPGVLQVYKNIELNARGKSLIGEDASDPREAILAFMRGESGRVPEALVLERLREEYGIDNGRAGNALTKLKRNGTLLASEKHGVEWVEVM